MKKGNRLFFLGVFNGFILTFAFLLFLVRMDEEFHFSDIDEPLGVDSIVYMGLSSYNFEEIENEYFKRQGPENIMDKLLHQYSMAGTIWEERWDSISDIEKFGILLNDTTIADRFINKMKRQKKGRVSRSKNLPKDTIIGAKDDSCFILTRNQKIEQLHDSIRVMKAKLAVYEQAIKWFRNADEDEQQRGIEQIRNIPKDVPLP
jgi:hypothetical protein